MSPERIVELRAVASETPGHGPFGWLTGTGLAGTWHEMLDEIERLQEATRWRDPVAELPSDDEPVLVRLRFRPAIAEYSVHLHAWYFEEEQALSGDILGWMPLPAPPPP